MKFTNAFRKNKKLKVHVNETDVFKFSHDSKKPLLDAIKAGFESKLGEEFDAEKYNLYVVENGTITDKVADLNERTKIREFALQPPLTNVTDSTKGRISVTSPDSNYSLVKQQQQQPPTREEGHRCHTRSLSMPQTPDDQSQPVSPDTVDLGSRKHHTDFACKIADALLVSQVWQAKYNEQVQLYKDRELRFAHEKLELQERIKDLEEMANQTKANLADIEEESVKFQAAVGVEMNNTISKLKSENEMLRIALTQVSTTEPQPACKWGEEMRKMDANVAQLKDTVAQLEKQLDTERQLSSKHQAELALLTQTAQQLEEKVRTLDEENQAIADEYNRVVSDNKNLQNELEETLYSFEMEKQDSARERKMLTTILLQQEILARQKLETELQTLKNERDSLSNQLQGHYEQMSSRDSPQKVIDSLKTEVIELLRKNERLETELKQVKAENNQLQNSNPIFHYTDMLQSKLEQSLDTVQQLTQRVTEYREKYFHMTFLSLKLQYGYNFDLSELTSQVCQECADDTDVLLWLKEQLKIL